MFLFAQMSIQTLGLFATLGWLQGLRDAWGRAVRWSDLLAPAAEIVIAYCVFVIVPLIFLWRATAARFQVSSRSMTRYRCLHRRCEVQHGCGSPPRWHC
jgi:hypothetical protein